MRTIKELVEMEVIYSVSPLISDLLQQEKYQEEFYHLNHATDWNEAEKDIGENYCIVQEEASSHSSTEEGAELWGVYDTDTEYYVIDPNCETKVEAIRQYFNEVNWDLSSYDIQVCEYWLITDWLANKLEDKGETVEQDFIGLCIWGRVTSGQSIWCDYVIQEIYNDITSKVTI